MILNKHRVFIREVADDFGISFRSYQEIFTDVLGMKRAAAKIVRKLLNGGVDIDQEMLAIQICSKRT